MPEVAGLKVHLALDKFPYPQVRVHKPALLEKQQEKAYTEYVQAEKATTHVCCAGLHDGRRMGRDAVQADKPDECWPGLAGNVDASTACGILGLDF